MSPHFFPARLCLTVPDETFFFFSSTWDKLRRVGSVCKYGAEKVEKCVEESKDLRRRRMRDRVKTLGVVSAHQPSPLVLDSRRQ